MGNDIDRSFGVLTYMNGLMCWSFVFRLVFSFFFFFQVLLWDLRDVWSDGRWCRELVGACFN